MKALRKVRETVIRLLGGYAAPTIVGDVHIYGDHASIIGVHLKGGSIHIHAQGDHSLSLEDRVRIAMESRS